MPAKIRLARHGKKKKPYYHIVIADSRAPRDGKFIEKIGNYNPNTNPASIEIDEDKALDWLQKGAQPTETARAILSYKGILLKKHLAQGVAKGALTEAEAEKKHKAWIAEQDKRIEAKVAGLTKAKDDAKKQRLAAEKEAKEAKEKEVQAKKSALAEEAEKAAKAAEEAPAAEEGAEATPAAEGAEEAPAAEAPAEEPAAEAKEEAPAAEAPAEEPAAEAKEEAPAAEAPAEAPAAEAPAEEPAAEAKEEAPAEEEKKEEGDKKE